MIVKHFAFAVPDELGEKVLPLVPAYAGLYTVGHGHYGLVLKTLKPAPAFKGALKHPSADFLHEAMYYKLWSWWRACYRENRAQLELLT